MQRKTVAVLFARADSIYKTMPECDVYDAERDARTYPGGLPIIAHPPCAQWGRLRAFSKNVPEQKRLALFAVDAVRRWGGVLEHPECSTLWDVVGLPKDESCDRWGGWTLAVHQYAWGHRAMKRTWLYIVGCDPATVPALPIRAGSPLAVIAGPRGASVEALISKREREATPPRFARWLVDLAMKCHSTQGAVESGAVVHSSRPQWPNHGIDAVETTPAQVDDSAIAGEQNAA